MIRATTAIFAGLTLTACSSLPGLEFPELRVRPEFFAMNLRGESSLQAFANPTGVRDTGPNEPGDFGAEDRDDDVGGSLAYGDGFSGFDFSYMQVGMDSTGSGTLAADFGVSAAGTTVNSDFFLEEFRIGYIGKVLEYETGDEALFRFGLGLRVAHRDGRFTVIEDGGMVSQRIVFSDDGAPFGVARLRGEYRGLSVTGEYGYAPNTFGGDFDGDLQDYAVTIAYELEDQDVAFLAGFRWMELPVSASVGDLRFDADFQLEGFTLGVEFRF